MTHHTVITASAGDTASTKAITNVKGHLSTLRVNNRTLQDSVEIERKRASKLNSDCAELTARIQNVQNEIFVNDNNEESLRTKLELTLIERAKLETSFLSVTNEHDAKILKYRDLIREVERQEIMIGSLGKVKLASLETRASELNAAILEQEKKSIEAKREWGAELRNIMNDLEKLTEDNIERGSVLEWQSEVVDLVKTESRKRELSRYQELDRKLQAECERLTEELRELGVDPIEFGLCPNLLNDEEDSKSTASSKA